MENNVNKPAENNNGLSVLAIMYGSDAGSTGGTTNRRAVSFDTEYFTASTEEMKQLTCNKDCTVTIKALVSNVNASCTGVLKNAPAFDYWDNYILGAGRVYTVPFTEEVTVSLNAGDYIAGCYQRASDRVNGGGCYLVYFPIE